MFTPLPPILAAVTSMIMEACIQRNIPAPTIMSESGRALASHHAIVVFDVLTRCGGVLPTGPAPNSTGVAARCCADRHAWCPAGRLVPPLASCCRAHTAPSCQDAQLITASSCTRLRRPEHEDAKQEKKDEQEEVVDSIEIRDDRTLTK